MAENLEEEIIDQNESSDTVSFDRIMGHLQEIILSEDFVCIRDMFFDDHCKMFEDKEENKLEYTSIFENYVDLVEGYLESELRERNQDFDMSVFLKEIESESNKDCIDSEVVDLLTTFSDFSSFKAAMLEAKKAKETVSTSESLEGLLTIKSV
ncbi:ADP-ribosylation factor-like protein 2-binding protein [Armadillidium vulgare]|nr:ADP-ribosylation factor-like protein 2-binding protein [Armadillidium vulgare]